MNRSPHGNDPFAHHNELRKVFEGNQVQFVFTELDTAVTFCEVAESSSDSEKIQRNLANARTAYNTALKFAGSTSFDAQSKSEFDAKRERVKALLTALGEHV